MTSDTILPIGILFSSRNPPGHLLEDVPLRAMEKIRAISERIVSALKEISENVEIEVGVEVDVVPKPVVRFFAGIHKYRKLMKSKGRNRQDENREECNKRLQSHDESTSKRNAT